MSSYVPYRDDMEEVPADEAETIQKIIDVMSRGQHDLRKAHGQTVRVSHAKAHAILRGTMTIPANLPPELAQGLFAQAGTHEVLVRMSQAPSEVLDDRDVSSPRGMAVKVFGVEGPKLPGHEDATTQDFVFDTSKVFINSNLHSFLASFAGTVAVAPKVPDVMKSVITKSAEAANEALHLVGADAPKLDFYGHPPYHPHAEAYYSQIALRYGDHVAKIAFIPANEELARLYREKVKLDDPDAVRRAAADYFRSHGAEYDVRVQLLTNEETMPIEDPMVEWPESESPFRTVAKLVIPPQNALEDTLLDVVDRDLSFAPAHALVAHRPLGAIGRARTKVYPLIAARRRHENERPLIEPTCLADVERLAARRAGRTKPVHRRAPSAVPWVLAGAGLAALGFVLMMRAR